ncbi:MAG TPA: helix-turn-helix transcriptional regulator [Nitrospiraceae bacterium]|nr:helix-turn-helix transcriptional regulator [Nitrospiraceae bacterium]
MRRETSAERSGLEIIRLCHSSLDSQTLRLELLKRLKTVIPFDCSFFSTTDPATLLFTSSLLDFAVPTWARMGLIENEYLQDDFNKFVYLLKNDLPVGVLSEQTQGELHRSQRYRDILTPLALEDEMRATFVANAACWGTLCLHRERATPAYTRAEAIFLAQLTPHIAEGLRKALLLEHATHAPTPDGPGVLLLSDDLSVVTTNPAAEYWLAELADAEMGDKHALPHIILTVVARLQTIERELAVVPAVPKVRLHTPSGQWLMVYASRLNRSGEQGQVAVMFEVAHPVEIAPLIMQAYHFTKREGEVTHLLLQGCATTEIAATLHISANTVQDHLKAIFEKVNVHSRRELTGRIFAQQYQPHFVADTPYQPHFRAAPVDVSGRLTSLTSLERPSS